LSQKAAVKRPVFSLLQRTGRLLTTKTLAGSLFHMFGTATLKARLPYAVEVRGTWRRVSYDKRSDKNYQHQTAGQT